LCCCIAVLFEEFILVSGNNVNCTASQNGTTPKTPHPGSKIGKEL